MIYKVKSCLFAKPILIAGEGRGMTERWKAGPLTEQRWLVSRRFLLVVGSFPLLLNPPEPSHKGLPSDLITPNHPTLGHHERITVSLQLLQHSRVPTYVDEFGEEASKLQSSIMLS